MLQTKEFDVPGSVSGYKQYKKDVKELKRIDEKEKNMGKGKKAEKGKGKKAEKGKGKKI